MIFHDLHIYSVFCTDGIQGPTKKHIKFVYFEQIFITMMDPSESKAKDNCKYGDFDQPIAH